MMRTATLLLVVAAASAVSAKRYNVKDFGAVGDGKTDDTAAIKKAIAAVKADGYGTVLIPTPGTYLSRPFNVTSNMQLIIEWYAVLLGSPVMDDYPVIPPLPSYGEGREMPGPRYSSLIHGEHVTNFTMFGGGTVDGNGHIWWDAKSNGSLKHTRPRLFEMMWCSDLTVWNIFFQNSPFWTVHPTYCNNVNLFNLTIINPPTSPNTDGIDVDSSTNVEIRSTIISVGDDHISLKSGWNKAGVDYGKPTSNVLVEACWFGNGKGLAIGSETSGGVNDVVFRSLRFQGFHNTSSVFSYARAKTEPARGGLVRNVTWQDINAYVPAEFAIQVNMDIALMERNALSEAHAPPPSPTLPEFRDLVFDNLTGQSALLPGQLSGLSASPISNVSLTDVHMKGNGKWQCKHVTGQANDVTPPTTGCFA